MNNNDIIEALRESNNIENVWDDVSLQQAIYAWNYVMGEGRLTPGVILKTHKILMLHQKLRPDEKGYFRKEQVYIGGREGKPWYAVPELIENWCRNVDDLWANNIKTDSIVALADIVQVQHVVYETIHPFIDGNGRTGRIFMNWTRVQLGLPILVIKEKEKGAYYQWFK